MFQCLTVNLFLCKLALNLQKKNTEYWIRASRNVKHVKSKNVSKTLDLAVLHFAQAFDDTPLWKNIWKRRSLDQQSKQ